MHAVAWLVHNAAIQVLIYIGEVAAGVMALVQAAKIAGAVYRWLRARLRHRQADNDSQMTQDHPETPCEHPPRQAVEAYNELAAHPGGLSPEAVQAVLNRRETLTSLVVLGTAADLQIADMERTMEELEAIFFSGDVTVSARLLRYHLTPPQRAELARLITEP